MPSLAPIQGILNQVIRQHGLEGKFREYQLLLQWEEIVGRTIAQHTYPETIRFKKLILRVDSPVWMQQLTFLKKDMLQKINETFREGMVQDIQLRLGLPDDASNPTDGPATDRK
jgi:predicted nucleic acid-binding Zn ribbon protein